MSNPNAESLTFTHSPIRTSHGPILIGIFISTILFGASIVQSWNYYIVYKQDPKWMKLYVGILILEDTINTALAIAWIYDLVINDFGNISPFLRSNWLLEMDPALGAIIAFTCQAFFTWRLHCLVRRWWIPMMILIPSLTGMAGGFSASIILSMHPDLTELRTFTPFLYFWLIPTIAADVIITGMLIYFLRQKRTKFAQTESILNKIMRQVSIQTCLLTTIVTIADIVSFVATPLPIHIAFSYCTPKLYTNSVLSSLNARPSRKYKPNEKWELPSTDRHVETLSDLQNRRALESGNIQNTLAVKPNGTEVYVNITTHVTHDVPSKSRVQEDDDSLPDQNQHFLE